MLARSAVVTALVAVLSITTTGQQEPVPSTATEGIQLIKGELAGLREELLAASRTPSEPTSGADPLPVPTLTEPFEIGEALYDGDRVADAVVSLLKLMQVAIVPDTAAIASAASKTGLTLSESEVQALIDLGRDDLSGSGGMNDLPYGFTELHASVAEMLPGVSAEQLAQAYSRAYEEKPDGLIAKAMMGRPIEEDMKITRAQIWFLLMDGFAGAASADGRWGTADKEVPDLKSPVATWSAVEFREVLARLPLVTAGRLVAMTAPSAITQGATAGPTVTITARVKAAAPALVSRVTGNTLIAARAGGSLAGQEATWSVDEESMLHHVGKAVTPLGEPVRVGAGGIAQFVFQPGVVSTGGAVQLIETWETIDVRLNTRGILASAYTVPSPLASMTFGSSSAQGNVRVQARSADVLWILVTNVYKGINFDLPGIGGGTRNGVDYLVALLLKRTGGGYKGTGRARVRVTQDHRGPSPCPQASVISSQMLRVTAEENDRNSFGVAHQLSDYFWLGTQLSIGRSFAAQAPDGGYYDLRIRAKFPPSTPESLCVPFLRSNSQGNLSRALIPLNDAQWVEGYTIALSASGMTQYMDLTSLDPLARVNSPRLQAARKAFGLTGKSTWWVMASPTLEAILAQLK